ncbi:hypothetical protein BC940DRAFT_320205 [Gongronella butleri]|nr:hypothetical protein BC940DRAFT_320205 [Gongronella butleri]
MDPLPLELLPCVLSFVPFHDLLRKARFVNRLWSREAGLVAFAKVQVTINRKILRSLVVMAAGRPKTRIPFKRVLFDMDWEKENTIAPFGGMYIGAGFNLVEFVLPLLADMRSLGLKLPSGLESLDDDQLAVLHKITGNYKLEKLDFIHVPPALNLQFPSHLSPSLRSLTIKQPPAHFDLNLVLSILQRLPCLQNLEISVKNTNVNGEHLRTFLYASLAKQPQHFSMRSVSLEFSSHESASVDRFGILDFFCFLTPCLCDLGIFRMPRDVGELEPLDDARLPVFHYGYPEGIAFHRESKESFDRWDVDGEFNWEHFNWDPLGPTPYLVEFNMLSMDFALAMLARIPLCTLEQLEISVDDDQVSTSSLDNLQCDTWQWSPNIKLENPLADVLSSFYAQHQRPDRSLQWLSLPVHLAHLSISASLEDSHRAHVHIILQSTDASVGPSVQVMWRIPRHHLTRGQVRRHRPKPNDLRTQLNENELAAFATGLKVQTTLLAAGSEISLPEHPSSAVDLALHGLCREFNATVYTCMSAKQINFI